MKKLSEQSNSERLRDLIDQAGLSQSMALLLFNAAPKKLKSPYSMSAWKAFLVTDHTSARWREFPDKHMVRAEKVFGSIKRTKYGVQRNL